MVIVGSLVTHHAENAVETFGARMLYLIGGHLRGRLDACDRGHNFCEDAAADIGTLGVRVAGRSWDKGNRVEDELNNLTVSLWLL